jgi:maleylacetoacetate isomerase
MTPLRLYHYWRSSSSWRVRWALSFKKIPYEAVAVNLLSDEPSSPEHRLRNPLGYVPVLEFIDETRLKFLGESMAILEWLEETVPTPPLLPKDPILRARSRQLSEIINAGTQPLQNPNVSEQHSSDPQEQRRWNQVWIRNGLSAYEACVQETCGKFSIEDSLTLADLYLIPQCYNAIRNQISLTEFPRIQRIYEAARLTESCKAAEPEQFEPKAVPKAVQ